MHILNSCNSSLSDSAVVVLNDALEVDKASAVVVATGFIVVADGAFVVDNLTNDKRFDPLHRFNPYSLNNKAYFLKKPLVTDLHTI